MEKILQIPEQSNKIITRQRNLIELYAMIKYTTKHEEGSEEKTERTKISTWTANSKGRHKTASTHNLRKDCRRGM